MSCYIVARAHADNTSKNYQRHLRAVKFCVENNLSLPKETSKYFKSENLEDYKKDTWAERIENGFSTLHLGSAQQYLEIPIEDIPEDTKKIIIQLEC